MSLKIEQRFDDVFFTETGPRIYTTGAHIVPMKIKIGQKQRYVWVVDEFKDDSYDEDGNICSPVVYSKKGKIYQVVKNLIV